MEEGGETVDGDHRWWTGMQSAKPCTKGVERAEWEKLHCKFVEMNEAVSRVPPLLPRGLYFLSFLALFWKIQK